MFHNLYFWAAVPFTVMLLNYLSVRARDWLLPITSSALVLYLDPKGGTILMMVAILVFFILTNSTKNHRHQKKLCIAGIVAVTVTLVFFKYLPQLLVVGHPFMTGIIMPLGISFLAFRLIHVLVECQRGTLPDFSVRDFFLYVFFFPIWLAGPIQRFDDFLANRIVKIASADITLGVIRVAWGLSKAFFLADIILPELYSYGVTPATISTQIEQLTILEVWRYLFVTYFILYADFSGYTDIAVGLSLLLGFRIIENFNFPFLAVNISDYWRRWHMSLAKWCQSYIYMPILARSRKPTLALYSTFLVMGIWHAASFHWVLWGIYHATGIWVYRQWDLTIRRHMPSLPRQNLFFAITGNTLTMIYVAGAGAFTSMHGLAPISISFQILKQAVGL
ncbi:MAG: MBOAT family O-acyltransferase [Desulforhopalus sp.]